MACLRPEFTRALAKQLSEGDCINLVSPHGQGRRRTLADLRRCLPASIRVLSTNLRDDARSLTAMLAGLSTQAGLAVTDSLQGLLNQLPQVAERTLIILHNFDELIPGTSSGFDDTFFGTLNGIPERPSISLLCVSERVPEGWPLRIDEMPLSPLTPDQILGELARRDPPVPKETWPDLAAWMAGQSAPYSLLDQPAGWPTIPHR